MMRWFKRKPKPKRHFLKDIGSLPKYYGGWRALQCTQCGKQFMMETLGGWGGEFEFKTISGKWGIIDKAELEEAYNRVHGKSSAHWYVVSEQICEPIRRDEE